MRHYLAYLQANGRVRCIREGADWDYAVYASWQSVLENFSHTELADCVLTLGGTGEGFGMVYRVWREAGCWYLARLGGSVAWEFPTHVKAAQAAIDLIPGGPSAANAIMIGPRPDMANRMRVVTRDVPL